MVKKPAVPDRGKQTVSPIRNSPLKKAVADGGVSDRHMLKDDAPAGAGSILKALRILEEVVDGAHPVSIANLATTLNYSKPTTHRIATFLEEYGYLEREPGGRRFIESKRLIELSLKVLLATAQRPDSRSILDWVVEKTGETCNFGIMHRGELVYLDRVESDWPLGLRFESGSRVPLHCTAIGKLFLSNLSRDALDDLLKVIRLTKYTDATIIEEDLLHEHLSGVRKAGISIDNQEFMYGVVCIAVPIYDQSGELRAGLAISAPEARMSAELAMEHAPVLRAAAARMQIVMFPPVKNSGKGKAD